jgi:Tfp pilus assembly protein PilO
MTSPRRVFLPVLVVLGAANLITGVAYTVPRTLREHTIEERVSVLQDELARQRRVTAEFQRVAEILRANKEDTQRLESDILPGKEEALVETLDDVEKTARRAGLKVESRLYHRETLKGTSLVRVTITMPLAGSYGQIVAFLRSVEDSPRFLTVDQIQLESGQGSSGQHLNVALSAYFRLEGGGSTARHR